MSCNIALEALFSRFYLRKLREVGELQLHLKHSIKKKDLLIRYCVVFIDRVIIDFIVLMNAKMIIVNN